MTNHIALSMATKGVLFSASPATKGVILISISETGLRRRKGVGVKGPEVEKKIITVSLIYNDNEYKARRIVNKNVKVTLDNIKVKIDESNKPTVIFKIL